MSDTVEPGDGPYRTTDVPADAEPEDAVELVAKQFRQSSSHTSYVAAPAPGYDIHGLWATFGAHHRSGYAAHAISLHWALEKTLKIPTQLIPHRNIDIDIERLPADRYDMLYGWTKKAVGHAHLLFSSFPIEVSAQMADVGFPPLIPYVAFEGTQVSALCRSLCNGEIFRSIWVVSEFVRRAMIEGGVDAERVRVVRPMLVGGPWNCKPLHERPLPTSDTFTFGTVGTWQKRKGMHDLVRAYWTAFRRADDVQLVIRTSVFGDNLSIRQFKEKLTDELAVIATEFGDRAFPTSKALPRIKMELGTDLTDQELLDWLATPDAYVSPSYGEGLGFPATWAKAHGVPLVASNFGALGDLMSEIEKIRPLAPMSPDYVFPTRLEPVDPEMLRHGAMFDRKTLWGVYDVSALAEAMAHCFAAGRRRDLAGANYVRRVFSEEVGAAIVSGELRAALPSAPELGWQ
jgi:glycosyltransferase involved in cell wall biosynthesis